MLETPVIIDCDPGHDDAIALWLALAHLDVRAVTTTHGNQTLDLTTANALRVLELVGSDIAVHAGADRPRNGAPPTTAGAVHGETGLDGSGLPAARGTLAAGSAVDAIVAAAKDDPLTIVAVGPLTNVAAALDADAGLASRLLGVTIMGGSTAIGNVTPVAEFNIFSDPEAAANVFASGVPIRMAGLNLTRQTACDLPTVDRLRDAGNVAGPVTGRLLDFYGGRVREMTGTDPVIHDACAVAWLIEPDLIESRQTTVEVSTEGVTRGMTVCDLRPGVTGGTAEVGMQVDHDGFIDLLAAALASHG